MYDYGNYPPQAPAGDSFGTGDIGTFITLAVLIAICVILLLAAIATVKAKRLPLRLLSVGLAAAAVFVAPVDPAFVAWIFTGLSLMIAVTVGWSLHKPARGELRELFARHPVGTFALAVAEAKAAGAPRSVAAVKAVVAPFWAASGLGQAYLALVGLALVPLLILSPVGLLTPAIYVATTGALLAVGGSFLLARRAAAVRAETPAGV